MDSVQLSPRILTQVFGTEFTRSVQGKYTDDTSSPSASDASNSKKIVDAHQSKNSTRTYRGSVSAGAAQDGLKPSKAPNISLPPPDNSLVAKPKEIPPNIDNLVVQMLQKLNQISEAGQQYVVDNVEGRLGPKIVKYDVAAYIGSFIISNDRLGVSSQCNFGSVRANTCVFKGKWQYELQLGSKGVMQLGWSTVTTKFSQEKGVGDTIDSYAYDGNRLRKWNQSTAPYGETWQNGDIIGCCIDLDQGHIEFYRNGKSLQIAFSNILRGSGIAYFPAASLAFNENIAANFGATPMQYAVPGYSPMQLQCSVENAKTDLLLQWLDKVLRLFPDDTFVPPIGNEGSGAISSDDYNTLMVVCNRIFEFLGPNMHSAFVVERAFLPFFAKTLGLPEKIGQKQDILNVVVQPQRAYLLLDVMWTFLEETEMKSYLERLCVILLSYFRSNSLSIKYPFHHYSLNCLIALCGHRRTRRHFLHHLLFAKTNRLMHFLHIRPLDEEVLKELIPEGWYPEKEPESSTAGRAYNDAIQLMSDHIAFLENLQIQFLKTLMTNSDGTEKRPSSRAVFLRKMRLFIRDTIRPGSVLQQSVNKAMCTFFRFLKTTAVLYSEELEENSYLTLPEIPPAMFYDTTVNYYDIERVGGLSSYLYKSNHVEVSQALHIDDYVLNAAKHPQQRSVEDNPLGVDTPVPGFRTILHVSGQNPINSLSVPLIRVSLPDNRQGGTLVAAQLGAPRATAHNQTDMIPVSVPVLARETAEAGTETQTPSKGLSSTNLGMLAGTGTGRRLIGRSVSATSSGEELERPLHTAGAALIAGSASGHNMAIPMITDFRSIINADGALFSGLMGFGRFEHRQHVYPINPATALLGRESGVMDPTTSLRELLDDSLIVLCCGVLKHVEKVVTLQKLIAEYTKAQKTAKENLNSANFSAAEKNEIQTSIEIFSRKLDEQSRHLAWVKAAVFTPERQQLGFSLLKTILKSLKTASSHGKLFAFVPELYISVLVNLTWLLLTQMNPVISYTNLPDVEETLADVAEFVATHFADTRIVIAETKDTMTQALSMFICNRTMLTALERMPSESQAIMINWFEFLRHLFDTLSIKSNISSKAIVEFQCFGYFRGLGNLIEETGRRTVSNFLVWNFAASHLKNLDVGILERWLDSSRKDGPVNRDTISPSRWKKCTRIVGYGLPVATAHLFHQNDSKTTAVKIVQEMFHFLKKAFQVLFNQDWIPAAERDQLKKKLVEKLMNMELKIGYPEFVLSAKLVDWMYEDIDWDDNSHISNVLKISKYQTSLFFLMKRPFEAMEVNAYYLPWMNLIEVPMGMLHYPMFDENYPMYLNYANLGFILGHEMAHAFDNNGIHHDKNGQFTSWWPEVAQIAYRNQTICFVEQYSKFEIPLIGQFVDGNYTLGENLSDNTGLSLTMLAYEMWAKHHKIQEPLLPKLNFTIQQIFFIAFGQLNVETPSEELSQFYAQDEHSPGPSRIHGVLQNSQIFSEAFACAAGSPMNPLSKCSLWSLW